MPAIYILTIPYLSVCLFYHMLSSSPEQSGVSLGPVREGSEGTDMEEGGGVGNPMR